MSDYGAYEGPRRYRSTRTRPRESSDADFVEETTYVERGKGPPPRDLVFRRDRDDDADSDRDYSPRGARRSQYSDYRDDYNDVRRSSRRARSHIEDDYDEYGPPAAAGAAAGYVTSRSRRDVDRDSRKDYYSDDDRSPPRKHERKKSGVEGMLESLGLGGVAGALAGKAKDRSRSRSRPGGRARSESPVDKSHKRERQWAQAAQAAIVAGAIEAYRSRKEPGPWTGGRGKRVATAAISAGGIDRLVGRDPDHKTKRHLVEAVIGGLAANRLANGPREKGGDERGRSKSRSRSIIDRFRSKSRGRSRSNSGSRDRGRSKSKEGALKNVAIGGAVAAAGKALYDRVRSKSRQRQQEERSRSSSSDDSYVASRRRRRDVGSYSQSRGGPNDGTVAAPPGRGRGSVAGRGDGSQAGSKRDTSTDSTSSTAIENNRRKMRGKEYLTAGLASVATIHAAHSVYNTIQGSEKRHKLVAEGEMTVEEARKKRHKAWLQDAAAIGIAALGIKGAYSEWKEMNEQRHEVKELEERRRKRAKRREEREREARMALAQHNMPPGAGYYNGPIGPGGLPPPPMGR